jgi:hypothetical protein
MKTQIEIVSYGGIDKDFPAQVRSWAGEVLKKSDSDYLRITIWKNNEELQAFFHHEKQELGVVTGEEIDFLATHEAWRGYPRIHISRERIMGISDAVMKGALQHEIAHASLHGRPEFYEFRFSSKLQEAGSAGGFDMTLFQECVYLLSIAMKDVDVVKWLSESGLGHGQQELLEYLMMDTEEEKQVWKIARHSPVYSKMALTALLKIILPIEALVAVSYEGAQKLKCRWYDAYEWLKEREKAALFRLCRKILHCERMTFQQRLEHGAFQLLMEPTP